MKDNDKDSEREPESEPKPKPGERKPTGEKFARKGHEKNG